MNIQNGNLLLFGAMFILIFTEGCGIQSHIEKSKNVDLFNYKSYAWGRNDNGSSSKNSNGVNGIVDENIRSAVNEAMEKKGFMLTDRNPDLIVDYKIAQIKTSRQNTSYYNQPYTTARRGRSYGMARPMTRTSMQNVTEGQLRINLTENKNKKLIWQGWALDPVNENTATSRQMQKDVKAIFKRMK